MTKREIKIRSDIPFVLLLVVIASTYVSLIGLMIIADLSFTSYSHIIDSLKSPEIQYSIKLSLFTCTVSMILSVIVSIPVGYIMTRFQFPGKKLLDALFDIPIILPPLVIGLSLLILFQSPLGKWIEKYISVTYAIPSIIIAQFSVACAFSIRTIIVAFDQISQRQEHVALTLGCNRSMVFWHITLPEIRNGILAAASLAWARSLGEFGPILLFSGTTRMKTEVLSSTVFLEMSVGNIEAAVAVSLIMIVAGFTAVSIVRYGGSKNILGTNLKK